MKLDEWSLKVENICLYGETNRHTKMCVWLARENRNSPIKFQHHSYQTVPVLPTNKWPKQTYFNFCACVSIYYKWCFISCFLFTFCNCYLWSIVWLLSLKLFHYSGLCLFLTAGRLCRQQGVHHSSSVQKWRQEGFLSMWVVEILMCIM